MAICKLLYIKINRLRRSARNDWPAAFSTRPAAAATILILFLFSVYCPQANCGKVNLPAGMEIGLKFKNPLSTKSETAPPLNDIIEVAVGDTIAGVGVLARGGRVYGRVIEFKKPRSVGRGGSIKIELDSIQTVLGKNIQIKPIILSARGKNKRTKAIPLLLLLGYGFFVKGEHAVLGEQEKAITVRTAKFEELVF